jgi:hypothetical protein
LEPIQHALSQWQAQSLPRISVKQEGHFILILVLPTLLGIRKNTTTDQGQDENRRSPQAGSTITAGHINSFDMFPTRGKITALTLQNTRHPKEIEPLSLAQLVTFAGRLLFDNS